ncbi:MAG: polyphosphate polymerase domain-containing protein [Muribaculaceae bacterium]|nr:polyphosphate polymerase domain-containing protein [Muribaculaceae bacterium]
MDYRHEWKIEINAADYLSLRTRLQAVMKQDTHAIDGKYFIRSLYFDDSADSALRDKIDGVNRREKFRIRYYNKDTSFICLEKKSKLNSLCNKQSAQITEKEAQSIVDGNFAWMMDSSIPLLQELYCKIKTNGLRPKTVVDYIREPFIYGPGNVRVTLDYNIRTGISCTDFLNADCVTIPAGDAPILMEVKWDAFLPDIIRDAIWLPGRRAAAFSKYAQCRIYG